MSLPENFICPITQTTMEYPVVCEDGITYERDAILQWFKSNNTSPVTRQIISSNIIPNLALRNTIQDYFKQQSQISINNVNTQSKLSYQKSNNISFIVNQSFFSYDGKGDVYNLIKLQFLNTSKKFNKIIAVVDTSGSMNENADVPGSESSGLTRLDLVKHTLNTIVHSLSDNDMLCIIKFSDTATVVSDFVKLTRSGKNIVLDNIKCLTPDGMTNLWAGIKLGIDKMNSIYSDDYNASMLIMTDGVSNSDPPRGIIPTLNEQIKVNKLNFTLNTFGYGYNIDSNLLNQIAQIGNGIFGFIPDATMVGTIFINMLSSILTGCINNLEIISDIPMLTSNNLGIISDQPVHLLFKNDRNINIKIKFNNTIHTINVNPILDTPSTSDIEQFMRIKLIDIINTTIKTINSNSLMSFKSELENFNRNLNSPYLKDLIEDIYSDDLNKGQLAKAVSRSDWFQQWGVHYLKSICRAHQLEKCITFKELSPQHYINQQYKSEQTRIEKIFCDLPAPTPSNRPYKYNLANTKVSMSTYYVQSGGCFDGNGKVTMYNPTNNTKYYKNVYEVNAGDYIFCPNSLTKYTKVKCVLKLKVNKEILMNDINNLKITPYHPVKIFTNWTFPKDINVPELTYIDYMYDFVLESNHIVEINNINVITLGHKFTFNEFVRHDYFGDKIIEDLKNHKDWINGYITLEEYEFIRGNDMKINKLKFII